MLLPPPESTLLLARQPAPTSNTENELSPWLFRILLAAVILAAGAAHLLWLAADSAIAGYDELSFIGHLIQFDRTVLGGSPFQWFGWLEFSSYPGLIYLLGDFFRRFDNNSIMAVRLVCVAGHLAWILLTYGIGKNLGGRLTGLIAAIIVAFSPLATVQARHFSTFTVHAACSALAVYTLLKTRLAYGLKGVLLTAFAFAAALLAERGTPIFYLAGPWLYALAQRMTSVDRRQKGRALWELSLAGLGGLLLAGPYLLGYLQNNMAHNLAQAQAPVIAGRDWTFYLVRLRSFLTGEAATPLLLVGAIGLGIRRDHRLLLLSLWAIVPLVFFSSLATRDMAHAMAMTTPLALLAGLGAALLPRRWWRLPLFAMLFLFLSLSWVRAGDPQGSIAQRTKFDFFGMYSANDTPIFAPKYGFDEKRLHSELTAAHAQADDLWVFTGAPERSWLQMRRLHTALSLQRIMALRDIPGRFLISTIPLFPLMNEAAPNDQHLVLVPAAALPKPSAALYLSRFVFEQQENDRYEPQAAVELAKLPLVRLKTFYSGFARVTLWRAELPDSSIASAASPL